MPYLNSSLSRNKSSLRCSLFRLSACVFFLLVYCFAAFSPAGPSLRKMRSVKVTTTLLLLLLPYFIHVNAVDANVNHGSSPSKPNSSGSLQSPLASKNRDSMQSPPLRTNATVFTSRLSDTETAALGAGTMLVLVVIVYGVRAGIRRCRNNRGNQGEEGGAGKKSFGSQPSSSSTFFSSGVYSSTNSSIHSTPANSARKASNLLSGGKLNTVSPPKLGNDDGPPGTAENPVTVDASNYTSNRSAGSKGSRGRKKKRKNSAGSTGSSPKRTASPKKSGSPPKKTGSSPPKAVRKGSPTGGPKRKNSNGSGGRRRSGSRKRKNSGGMASGGSPDRIPLGGGGAAIVVAPGGASGLAPTAFGVDGRAISRSPRRPRPEKVGGLSPAPLPLISVPEPDPVDATALNPPRRRPSASPSRSPGGGSRRPSASPNRRPNPSPSQRRPSASPNHRRPSASPNPKRAGSPKRVMTRKPSLKKRKGKKKGGSPVKSPAGPIPLNPPKPEYPVNVVAAAAPSAAAVGKVDAKLLRSDSIPTIPVGGFNDDFSDNPAHSPGPSGPIATYKPTEKDEVASVATNTLTTVSSEDGSIPPLGY